MDSATSGKLANPAFDKGSGIRVEFAEAVHLKFLQSVFFAFAHCIGFYFEEKLQRIAATEIISSFTRRT
jgi:hypothetical protein